MTIGPAPMCLFCKHFLEDEEGNKCKAFPQGIPREIFYEYYDHRKEFSGDGGIRFELKYEEDREAIEFIYGKEA
ncbi:MAG: hypothetical protein PWQ91_521 [Eubacteriales bacterium]|nr:hypothetical protein [Eubacteriales bacterium]